MPLLAGQPEYCRQRLHHYLVAPHDEPLTAPREVQVGHPQVLHSPDAADKQGQKTIGTSGCAYADAHLIPALHSYGKFVDQEKINP